MKDDHGTDQHCKPTDDLVHALASAGFSFVGSSKKLFHSKSSRFCGRGNSRVGILCEQFSRAPQYYGGRYHHFKTAFGAADTRQGGVGVHNNMAEFTHKAMGTVLQVMVFHHTAAGMLSH